MSRRYYLCICVVAFLLHVLTSPASAQNYVYATGAPSFSTTFPVENGFINISNGNLHLEIPLAAHKQRGGRLSLNERLVYDSRIWKIVQSGSNYSWQPTNVPNSMGGWRLVTGGEAGNLSTHLVSSISQYCATPNGGDGYENIVTYGYSWTAPDGTPHDFNATLTYDDTNCTVDHGTTVTINPGPATDATGYHLEDDGNGNPVIWDKDGFQVYPSVRDPNGNSFSFDANGNLIDTAGRTPVLTTTSGNQVFYDVLTVGGGRARYTVTTRTVYVNTGFGQSAVSEYSGSFTAIQSIQLPDGTSYSFNYDSGTSAGNYGELTSVTLPTGGAVAYGYTNYQDSFNNKNRWIASRIMGGGTTTFTPAVLSTCSGGQTGCKEKVTVKKPSGKGSVYTLTLNNGSWNTQTDVYAGTPEQSGILVTTTSEYNFNNPCPSGICVGAQLITTSSVSTTFPATGQITRTEYVYDYPQIGKVSHLKQWDYYTGSKPDVPTRQIDNLYGATANGSSLVTQNTLLDASGNIGGKSIYGYNGSGNVTSVTEWLDSAGNSIQTSASFDDVGNLISSTDANQHTTVFAYDGSRTCVTKTTAPNTGTDHIVNFGCDSSTGLQTSVTDENSQTTSFEFDNMQRPTRVYFPDGGERHYDYTAISVTQSDKLTAGGGWAVLQTVLDAYGRSSSVQNQSGGSEISTVTYAYDTDGRLQSKSNPFKNGASNPTDGVTQYAYDGLDRIQTQTQPNNSTIQFAYSGNAVTVTDENSHRRKNAYDAFGRLVAVWEPDAAGNLNWETDYAYSALNDFVRVDQKGGSTDSSLWRTRIFAYDFAGRKVSETVPESGTTHFWYDGNGNLTQVQDARGATVSYAYDALNRLSSKTLSDRSQAYAYTYDLPDHPLSQGRLSSMSNGLNYTAHFGYDAMGHVVSQTYCLPSQGGVCNKSVSASYDLVGNLVQLVYPDGRAVKQNYDSTSRLASVVYDNWGGQPVGTTYLSNLSYDPAGNVRAATFGNGVVRQQDFNNILASTALNYTKSGTTLWSKQYHWDNKGVALTQIADTLNSQRTRNFAYDQLDRLVSASGGGNGATSGTGQLTISGQEQWTEYQDCYFDGLDWYCNNINVQDQGVVSATIGGFTKGANYSGNSTPQTIASGIAQAFNAEISSPVTASVSGNVVTFRAKATGSATNYTFSASVDYYSEYFSVPSFEATSSAPTLTGGLDGSGPGYLNQAYTLDAWGNLQQSGTFNFQQAFNGNNQISTGGYQYDAAGNLTNSVDHSYQWDAEERVKTVDSGSLSYAYDSDGRRIRKDSSGGALEYVYFDGQLIAELAPNTGIWHDYIYAGPSLIAEVDGSQSATATYRMENHLGSLGSLADNSGTVISETDLAPYGQVLTDQLSSQFKFAGLYRDDQTAMDHAWYREYAPNEGRWLSPDPYSGSYDFGDPQSFNRYAYVSGNPLLYTDPNGLFISTAAPAVSAGCPWCGIALGIGSIFADIFGFGHPHFKGSLKPRPSTIGGNFPDGESLGIPTGMSLPSQTIWQALGIVPIANTCDFGPCLYGELPGSMPEIVQEKGFLDRFSDCFKKHFADPLLATSATMATPVPKVVLGMPTTSGASPVTNVISVLDGGKNTGFLSMPRLGRWSKTVFGTQRLGGALGRANTMLSEGLFIKDTTRTFFCAF